MEVTKILFEIRKNIKRRAFILSNNRKNREKPNATLKSVLNEALEIGLAQLEQAENLGSVPVERINEAESL